MLLDIAVISGFVYSIFGNVLQYRKNRENVENEVEKLEGETDILSINSYEKDMGLLYNITSEKQELILLSNKERDVFVKDKATDDNLIYKIRYANKMSDLDKIYQKYDITSDLFPISFPLKIYQKTITTPIYHNYHYFDLKKSNVVNKILLDKRLPFTFMVFGISTIVVGITYLDYKFDKKWGYPLRYPILHPKRYDTFTKDIKTNIKKWLE